MPPAVVATLEWIDGMKRPRFHQAVVANCRAAAYLDTGSIDGSDELNHARDAFIDAGDIGERRERIASGGLAWRSPVQKPVDVWMTAATKYPDWSCRNYGLVTVGTKSSSGTIRLTT